MLSKFNSSIRVTFLNTISQFIASFFLTLLIAVNVAGQSSVRFVLDSSMYPVEAGDIVMLCGSGTTLGEWESREFLMNPSFDNSNEYTLDVLFSPDEVGTEISFKYVVIKPDNIQYWEEVANRSLQVPTKDTELEPVAFENRTKIGVNQTILPVTIAIDLRLWEDFENHLDGMGVKGTIHPLPLTLREESDPLALNDDDGDGIWTIQFNVLYGSPREFSFSLYYLQQDQWSLHMLYGKQEHVALLPENAKETIISLAYDPETGGFISTSPEELLVNNYPEMYRTLGNWAEGTRFQYFAAMEFLKLGQPLKARQAYEKYAQARNTDWDVRDDFDYMWIQYVGETEGVAQAEAYARQAGQNKYEYLRRSYLAKVAEVAYMVGDHKRSKTLSRQLYNSPQFEDELTWNEYFSRQILAMSYIADNEKDSTELAMQLFNKAASDSSDLYWQRNAQWQQVYTYTDTNDLESAIQVYEKLSRSGLPGQRMAARHQLVEFHLRNGEVDLAKSTLDEIDDKLKGYEGSETHNIWWLRQQIKRARFYEQVDDTLLVEQTLLEAQTIANPKQLRHLNRALEAFQKRKDKKPASQTNMEDNQ